MKFLIALPLLSVAYAQGTAAGADSGQVLLTDRDPLGDQEYQKVCLSPTDTEVEIAPGTSAQYYCDRQPQHWNDKVAGAESIEACALACTDIETCKGTFWKSKDGTCWWSDQDFLVGSDGEPSPCTVVPGSVYMTVRKDQPDGCTIELAECHKRAQALEDEIKIWKKKDRDSATQIIELTKQIKELDEKISQAGTCPINGRNWAVYQQKEPTISYGKSYEITRKQVASACDCMKFCATYTTCKWAHFSRFGGSSRNCVLYSNAVSKSQMRFRSDWDIVTYA